MVKNTVRTNQIKVRNYLMVAVINGITKAAVHTDLRKHHNRNACRSKDWQKEQYK